MGCGSSVDAVNTTQQPAAAVQNIHSAPTATAATATAAPAVSSNSPRLKVLIFFSFTSIWFVFYFSVVSSQNRALTTPTPYSYGKAITNVRYL